MNFSSLCDFFESLRKTKGTTEKTDATKIFFKRLREVQHETFPILRLVVPRLDRDRPAYRIKESKITKILIKMLDLPQGGDRNVLSKSTLSSGSDFSDVIYSVLKKYIVNQNTVLTVENVNQYLDRIANRTTDNDLDDLMLEILRKLSSRDSKWFIRIVLKDTKLGVGDNSILNCFHEDAAAYYATNNNLKKVCDTLNNPQVKLHELEINIFEPFRPMLSKRCDSSNFKKCFPIKDKPFLIENKFDGERFQLHMDGGQFKYFSRNGFNFTDSYGASYNEGIFTPFLKNAFNAEVNKVILDGEMMLWNKNTKNFGSKGMNLDVKKLRKGKYQPCFCVFDILMWNNRVLTNQPLQKRLNILRRTVVNPVVGTIVISDYGEAHSLEDIVTALNKCVDNNEEGIVVKDPQSVYKCSDRNSGWYKIKMEYFDDVVHDLDLLMMGGCYGSSGKINSFFVGVSSGTDTYFSMGKIGTGLNDEQLDLLNDRLKSHGTDYKAFATNSEGKLLFGKDTPDVYIEPQHSCAMQIRATELVRTTNDSVKTPYTLRFPRVLRLREDKPVDECLSMNELLELTQQNKAVIKLNKRRIELCEIAPKKSVASKKIKYDVIKLERSEKICDVLRKKKIFVCSGNEKWAKDDICNSVKRAGGNVAYKLEPDIDIVLTSKLDKKVTELMKEPNRFDIVHVDWLRRVLDARKLLNYDKEELVSCGFNSRGELSSDFDMYGDSYVEKATPQSLKHVFDLMKHRNIALNVNDTIVFDKKSRAFEDYAAYFDRFEEVNNPDSKVIYSSLVDEVYFQYYKGSVSEKLTLQTNLIVIREKESNREKYLVEYLEGLEKGLGSKIKMVPKMFLYNTIDNFK